MSEQRTPYGIVIPPKAWHRPQPRLSPHDGPVVALFAGVWHADPITPDILEAGTYLAFTDFQLAVNGLHLARSQASRVFGKVYNIFQRASDDAVGLYGMASPSYAYYTWGDSRNPQRRGQILLGTQQTFDLSQEDAARSTPRFTKLEQRVLNYVLHDVDMLAAGEVENHTIDNSIV